MMRFARTKARDLTTLCIKMFKAIVLLILPIAILSIVLIILSGRVVQLYVIKPIAWSFTLFLPGSFLLMFKTLWVDQNQTIWQDSFRLYARHLHSRYVLLKNVTRRIKNLANRGSSRFIVVALVIVAVGTLLTVLLWEWLHGTEPAAPASTTLRNMGLLIGGGLALVFAVWRGFELEKQSATSHRATDISDQDLLNERYQRGAEMLGSEVLSIRMAGIYALQHLAEEHPEQYHIQIMRLFCAFARNPTGEVVVRRVNYFPGRQATPRLREDVQAVMDAIGGRNADRIFLEQRSGNFRLNLTFADLVGANLNAHYLGRADLTHANLSEASLHGCNLRHVDFSNASLSNASLVGSDLSMARMKEADLTGADFRDTRLVATTMVSANLLGADLEDADLTNATFEPSSRQDNSDTKTQGLTQPQLDLATCRPRSPPPRVLGLVDAETREPLIWRGRSLDPKAKYTVSPRVDVLDDELRRLHEEHGLNEFQYNLLY